MRERGRIGPSPRSLHRVDDQTPALQALAGSGLAYDVVRTVPARSVEESAGTCFPRSPTRPAGRVLTFARSLHLPFVTMWRVKSRRIEMVGGTGQYLHSTATLAASAIELLKARRSGL